MSKIPFSALKMYLWFALGKCLPARHPIFPYFWGNCTGRASYHLGSPLKHLVFQELRVIFPNKSQRELLDITREAYVNYYTSRFEQFHYPYLNENNVGNLISIEGKASLEKALEKGKGIIALHPHFGSYLLVIPAFGYNGYPVSQVAMRGDALADGIDAAKTEINRFSHRAYEYRVNRFEDCLPGEFINIKHPTNLRKVLRKLQANEIIAISATGRRGRRFLPVDLCGRTALLSAGPFELCLRSGATLLPMFVVRTDGARHSLVIKPPIHMDLEDKEETVAAAMQQFADHLSHHIRQYPHLFAMRLARMRKRAHWDDHPFFTDYGE